MKLIIILAAFVGFMPSGICQNQDYSIERFKVLSDVAESTGLHTGQLDSATCVEMLRIAQHLQNDSLLAISYNLISQYISRVKGDNIAGLEYNFKAIPLAEKAADKRRLSSIYFDISLIYFTLQNNEESVKYVKKGGYNLPDKSHPLYDYMLAQFYRGMAIYFVVDKEADSALAYAQQLLLTARKIKSPLFEFSAMYLNGAACALQGDADLAQTWFKKAGALSDSLRSPFGVLRFAITYLPFLIQNHNLDEAKLQAQQILKLGTSLGNNDLKLTGAGFLRQVYDSLHRADSVYYYSRMEATLNAAIFSQNNINKIQALAFNEQIRIIEDEAKAKQAEEDRKHNLQYALIAVGILILITLYLLLSRSFITNTNLIKFFGVVALLIVFEFLNLLLHPFLERITNHSPLFMLLALVCIAALLVPLHHKLEHWATTKLVEKNKKIRLAAAKKTVEELENKKR